MSYSGLQYHLNFPRNLFLFLKINFLSSSDTFQFGSINTELINTLFYKKKKKKNSKHSNLGSTCDSVE